MTYILPYLHDYLTSLYRKAILFRNHRLLQFTRAVYFALPENPHEFRITGRQFQAFPLS
jgi:hypothetical protein